MEELLQMIEKIHILDANEKEGILIQKMNEIIENFNHADQIIAKNSFDIKILKKDTENIEKLLREQRS